MDSLIVCVLMDQGGGIKFSSLIINACTLEGNIIKELLWCWGLILRVPLGGVGVGVGVHPPPHGCFSLCSVRGGYSRDTIIIKYYN